KVNDGTYVTFNTKLSEALEGVSKVDDHTVAFTLKAPLSPFIGIMAHQSLAITSAEYADVMLKAGKPEEFDRQPIGTGPFALQNYQRDAVVRLQPFKETWGAAIGDASRTPLVDSLVMAISADASVRLQRAEAGECQIALYPNLADREQIEKSPTLDLVRTPIASTGFITFNFNEEMFKDKRVRQALSYAINMKPLVDVVYNGMGRVTGAVIPPSLWSSADIGPYEYNPEKAKELLKEAGYADGFSTQLWAVPVARPYMPNGRRAAEMIQADWAAVGVKAEIVSYEWGEYIARSRKGEAKVGMFGGIWDFPDPSQIPNNYFNCDATGKPSPSNIGAWCNPDFRAAMNKAGEITDQAERAKLYVQAQEILHEDAPAVILGGADMITAVSKKVKGYHEAVFGTSRLSGVTVEE
ncbi:ABC transporter substrate-binding protein, partial [Escherichia coli]|nr:ABC transporter substrate-binding protein [Escherichia coli]